MKVTYDKLSNAMYILFNDKPPISSQRITNDFRLDMDADGNVLGIELLNVSHYVDDPTQTVHELLTVSERPSQEAIRARRAEIEAARRAKKVTEE